MSPRYFRPAEVETLLGDATKAKVVLGWTPEISVQEMCREMLHEDLAIAKRLKFMQESGHQLTIPNEG